MSKQKKILIVEDDLSIIELISYNLESEYDIQVCNDGQDAWVKLQNEHFDLVLLDLMIPSIDGITLCKRVRSDAVLKMLPIIMLTAKSSEQDRVLGLDVGADDYITKPFSVRELMSRINAIIRRVEGTNATSVMKIKGLVINEEEFTITDHGKLLDLTLKEFMLLKTLAEHAGKVLSRSMLLDTIWGYEYLGETRTVDVHIRHLRSKLKDPDIIETVRGVGYKMTP